MNIRLFLAFIHGILHGHFLASEILCMAEIMCMAEYFSNTLDWSSYLSDLEIVGL